MYSSLATAAPTCSAPLASLTGRYAAAHESPPAPPSFPRPLPSVSHTSQTYDNKPHRFTRARAPHSATHECPHTPVEASGKRKGCARVTANATTVENCTPSFAPQHWAKPISLRCLRRQLRKNMWTIFADTCFRTPRLQRNALRPGRVAAPENLSRSSPFERALHSSCFSPCAEDVPTPPMFPYTQPRDLYFKRHPCPATLLASALAPIPLYALRQPRTPDPLFYLQMFQITTFDG